MSGKTLPGNHAVPQDKEREITLANLHKIFFKHFVNSNSDITFDAQSKTLYERCISGNSSDKEFETQQRVEKSRGIISEIISKTGKYSPFLENIARNILDIVNRKFPPNKNPLERTLENIQQETRGMTIEQRNTYLTNRRIRNNQERDYSRVQESLLEQYKKDIFSGIGDATQEDIYSFLDLLGLSEHDKKRVQDFLEAREYLQEIEKHKQEGDPYMPSKTMGSIGEFLGLSEQDLKLLQDTKIIDLGLPVRYEDPISYPDNKIFSCFSDIRNIFGPANVEVSQTPPEGSGWITFYSQSEDIELDPYAGIWRSGYSPGKDEFGTPWILENDYDIGLKVISPTWDEWLDTGEKRKTTRFYVRIKQERGEIPTPPSYVGVLQADLQDLRDSGLKNIDENLFYYIWYITMSKSLKQKPSGETASNMTGYISLFPELISSTPQLFPECAIDIDFTTGFVGANFYKEDLRIQGDYRKNITSMIPAMVSDLLENLGEVPRSIENLKKYGRIDMVYADAIEELVERLKKDCLLQDLSGGKQVILAPDFFGKLYGYQCLFSTIRDSVHGNAVGELDYLFTSLKIGLTQIYNMLFNMRNIVLKLEKEAGRSYYINLNGKSAKLDIFEKYEDSKYGNFIYPYEILGKTRDFFQSDQMSKLSGFSNVKKVLETMDIEIGELWRTVSEFIQKNRGQLTEEQMDIIELPIKDLYNKFYDESGNIKEGVTIVKGVLAWQNLNK